MGPSPVGASDSGAQRPPSPPPPSSQSFPSCPPLCCPSRLPERLATATPSSPEAPLPSRPSAWRGHTRSGPRTWSSAPHLLSCQARRKVQSSQHDYRSFVRLRSPPSLISSSGCKGATVKAPRMFRLRCRPAPGPSLCTTRPAPPGLRSAPLGLHPCSPLFPSHVFHPFPSLPDAGWS